jgi:hypothetical protein
MLRPFATIYRASRTDDPLVSVTTPGDFVTEMARLMLEFNRMEVTATFHNGIDERTFGILMDEAAELAAELSSREG